MINHQWQVLVLLLSRGALCGSDDLEPFRCVDYFPQITEAVRLGEKAREMREELYRHKLLDAIQEVCKVNVGFNTSNLICEYADVLPSWINLDSNSVVFECWK
jgi:hypothetical protein